MKYAVCRTPVCVLQQDFWTSRAWKTALWVVACGRMKSYRLRRRLLPRLNIARTSAEHTLRGCYLVDDVVLTLRSIICTSELRECDLLTYMLYWQAVCVQQQISCLLTLHYLIACAASDPGFGKGRFVKGSGSSQWGRVGPLEETSLMKLPELVIFCKLYCGKKQNNILLALST